MFPGINPREMHKAMKRLGIWQEEIDANLVIIKTHGGDIIIKNPQVSRVNMMGQETFQIVGNVAEAQEDDTQEISEEDIATVMGQISCSREEALDALEGSKGNLAEAILRLQKK